MSYTKEIKVNEDGSVEVHVHVPPAGGHVTEIRQHNVEQMLKEAGVKHGPGLDGGNIVLSSDLNTKDVSSSGVYRFEAPQVVPAAIATMLGLDPSMRDVVIEKKPATKKPTTRKRTSSKTSSKKKVSTKTPTSPTSTEG